MKRVNLEPKKIKLMKVWIVLSLLIIVGGSFAFYYKSLSLNRKSGQEAFPQLIALAQMSSAVAQFSLSNDAEMKPILEMSRQLPILDAKGRGTSVDITEVNGSACKGFVEASQKSTKKAYSKVKITVNGLELDKAQCLAQDSNVIKAQKLGS